MGGPGGFDTINSDCVLLVFNLPHFHPRPEPFEVNMRASTNTYWEALSNSVLRVNIHGKGKGRGDANKGKGKGNNRAGTLVFSRLLCLRQPVLWWCYHCCAPVRPDRPHRHQGGLRTSHLHPWMSLVHRHSGGNLTSPLPVELRGFFGGRSVNSAS